MAVMNLSLDEFLAFMKQQQGSQTDAQFAEAIGVSPQYLCDVYYGRRIPGQAVADAFGATKGIVYTINSEEKEK